ncbi:hypothetical protein HYG89_05025 [Acinetobacter sp. SwsAc5]|uniref:hypothetical protein n=1 Tax=Acinetobacter sp. SwsAc5 TaxID=2749438 RepID=UPI0015BD1EA3|nr:hypothetical protein [Acinetobacter sp. SwsAc5]NWK51929.1 hypothetical protein [Acinetobacter sp. SwsAc5]
MVWISEKFSIFIVGTLTSIVTHAYTTDYDQKYFTPIKLNVDKVHKIINKANKSDPNVLHTISGDGYGSVIFIPKSRDIKDSDMALTNTLSYGYSTNYVKKKYRYTVTSVSTNCKLSYLVMGNAYFNANGTLTSIQTHINNVNPQHEPQCKFEGKQKLNPNTFSDLRLDTKELNKLFKETTKADKDIYAVKNISDNYKELVFQPYVYDEHKNTNKKTIYSYVYSKNDNGKALYSFKADELNCDNMSRESAALTFNKNGTFNDCVLTIGS